METYGKQNIFQREWLNVKERFTIGKATRNYVNGFGIGVYTPKLKKVRVVIGSVGLVACAVTPFTNWAGFFILRWGLK